MKEYRFLIDDEGELSIIDEDGGLTLPKDEGVQRIKTILALNDIKEKILNDPYMKGNAELAQNINYIVKNYYLDMIQLVQLNHAMLFRLAVAEARDELEDEGKLE